MSITQQYSKKQEQTQVRTSQENSRPRDAINHDTSYTSTIPHEQPHNRSVSVNHSCVMYAEPMSTEKRLEAVGLKIIEKQCQGYTMKFIELGGAA